MDQGKAEILGFMVLVVILPVVAVLLLARRIRSPFAAFAVILVGSAVLPAAAGEVYPVGLAQVVGRSQTNWHNLWILGALFGGAAGLGCGVLRAVELARRRDNAETGTAPDRPKWRWVEWVFVGVLGVAVVGAEWLDQRGQRLSDRNAAAVNADNFQRIQVGMSAEEVNRIFGVPPGDYRRPPGFLLVGPGHVPWSEAAIGGRLAIWYVPHYHAEVLFDRDDFVVGAYWCDYDAIAKN